MTNSLKRPNLIDPHLSSPKIKTFEKDSHLKRTRLGGRAQEGLIYSLKLKLQVWQRILAMQALSVDTLTKLSR
jgi:hypothetical protein